MLSQGGVNFGGLTFYLDGAHSPESAEICAKWFSDTVKKEKEQLDSDAKNVIYDHFFCFYHDFINAAICWKNTICRYFYSTACP